MFGKPRGRNGKKKRKPGTPAFDDLVKRNFTAEAPNLKDCFSNKIVGYSIDSRMKARLAVAALENAAARRRAEGADPAALAAAPCAPDARGGTFLIETAIRAR